MSVHRLIGPLLCVLFFSATAIAQTPKRTVWVSKKIVGLDKLMFITYNSPSWNKDSLKNDSAMIIMREKTSAKIVHIHLEETEPDSSQFTGNFSVQISDVSKIQPEIFIPPTDYVSNEAANKKLHEAIQNGSLPRRPFVWKKGNRGQTILDVYDTREQAEEAYKIYQEELRLAGKVKSLGKTKLSKATPLTEEEIEYQSKLAALAKESAKFAEERAKMEGIERQMALNRLTAFQKLSEKERADRKAKAAEIGKEAMLLYSGSKFPEAEAKFREAADLDPTEPSYYYYYGINKYRNNQFNESLAILKLSKPAASMETERQFYMGLVYYRLNDFVPALQTFEVTAKSEDAMMGPSSAFYQGIILFTLEQHTEAKKKFEHVIDVSQDPAMDTQAEQYLEYIASAMVYQKMLQKKWSVSGTLGAMYDSNVLSSPDNAADQGSATSIADYRLLTMGILGYRPILNKSRELSIKLTGLAITSVKDAASVADPVMGMLAVPYTYKGTVWKKGYQLVLTPGYDKLYMDPRLTGNKTEIQNSTYLSADNTFVMTPTYFATYGFEYRMDNSTDVSSVGPEDGDSNKYTLKTAQMFFVDAEKKKMLIANAGYILNAAKGEHKDYNRVDIGLTLTRPVFWNMGGSFGIACYQLKYPTASPARTDFNSTLSASLSKPHKEWVSYALSLAYTKNDSDQSANEYSKYTAMLTATFNTNF